MPRGMSRVSKKSVMMRRSSSVGGVYDGRDGGSDIIPHRRNYVYRPNILF